MIISWIIIGALSIHHTIHTEPASADGKLLAAPGGAENFLAWDEIAMHVLLSLGVF